MVRKLVSILSTLVVIAVFGGLATAAPMLKVTKSVTINASAAEAWDEVNDFDDFDEWHPAVVKAEIINLDVTLIPATVSLKH